ncbi:MAG: hypothetical protein K6G17_03040 [Oscillospiraceae bacterium]|nr:hypothetical protein [Oscillospiraceae bacterium]
MLYSSCIVRKEAEKTENLLLYGDAIPPLLEELCETAPMRRLSEVGMNCGCEYTAFPLFRGLRPYSRFEHSLGTALIVWRFTGDPAQAAAGLLHDIATPVFAHVVDFLRGDALRQEATEEGTEALIASSGELQAALRRRGLNTDAVCDYRRYPIADNDAPRLSADRLEYTLGNSLRYGFLTLAQARSVYDDLFPAPNEDGEPELCFRSREAAEAFSEAALRCSKVYVSGEDRYAMQRLAELLRLALDLGVLAQSDLLSTEPAAIRKLLSDDETAQGWRAFRALHRIVSAETPGEGEGGWRQIRAKKRCIDPLLAGAGRMSALSPRFGEALSAFLAEPQSDWLCGQ